MSDISLSKAVRSNLLSLQNTADLMAKTQNRLSTGNKVNSALDNPTNFFTASSLNSRAGDLNQLMDSMANGIQTLEAADNGLTAITKTLESMQSTLRQARQDKSFETQSYSIPTTGTPAGQLSFSGGAFDAASNISLTKTVTSADSTTPATGATFTLDAGDFATSIFGTGDTLSFDINLDGGGAENITITEAMVGATGNNNATIDDVDELAAAINAAIADHGGIDAQASVDGDGNLVITNNASTGTGSSIVVDNFTATDTSNDGTVTTAGLTNGAAAAGKDEVVTPGTPSTVWKTVDDLVSEINAKTVEGGGENPVYGKVRASNDNGKLRIENLSTTDLTVAKPTGVTGEGTIKGNTVRADLANQYNELRDQLDKLADDASFNGINLLRGDKLTITFNETGTSSIDINTKGEEAINSANLKISTWMNKADLDSDTNIDAELDKLKAGLNQVRSQASTFGSNLSIVQNRQDFTKNMINTLQTGAANLTLADMNEEAANLLALQTRQSLSSSSLSLASQADQSVLQLIR